MKDEVYTDPFVFRVIYVINHLAFIAFLLQLNDHKYNHCMQLATKI